MNIVIDSVLSQIGDDQRAARWETLLRKLAAAAFLRRANERLSNEIPECIL
jgi:hypothetical protein